MPALGRRREALDLAAVDAHLAPGLLGQRRPRRRRRRRRRVASTARRASVDQTSVPPTVIAPIRTWPWPVPTGTFWPALAADAGLHLEVVADRVDRRQRLQAVADQGRAAAGPGDPAVLDQVALGDAEDEVAGGRVDLAAAEGDRVEAAARPRRSSPPARRRRGRCRCWSCAGSAGGGSSRGGRCRSRRRRRARAREAGRRGRRRAAPPRSPCVFWVGVPSSSIASLPHSPGMRPSS